MINLISVLPSSLSHSLPQIVMLSFFSLPSFAAQLSLLMSPLLLSGLLTMAECDALMRLGKSLFFTDLRCFFKFQIWCSASGLFQSILEATHEFIMWLKIFIHIFGFSLFVYIPHEFLHIYFILCYFWTHFISLLDWFYIFVELLQPFFSLVFQEF